MIKASTLLREILQGGAIESKLSGAGLAFDSLDWTDFEALSEPVLQPGRSGNLSPSVGGVTAPFPKLSELGDPRARGILLHYFANHELLAIETMAYVLLKFPEADLAFKRGVFHTLKDEQRHLGLYLKRMRELGVELGSVPLNLYFWNSLKDMRSPLDFITQMSLTFEQANLDFALYYSELFRTQVLDSETADLLQAVHDDEVKHVAHGMKWFNEWRDPESTEFEAYAELLPYPMTPRRAKGGLVFAEDSRRSAGMSDAFIHSVEVAGGSRGKVPNLFFFNPQCDMENQFPTLGKSVQEKLDDLNPLVLWLAQEEDVVEMHHRPELSWLREIHRIKGELPEIVAPPLTIEKYQVFEEFKPWGFSESAWQKFEPLANKFRIKPKFSRAQHTRNLFSKSYWKSVLPDRDAEFATSPEVLLKSDQSTSGRGHQRIARERFASPDFQAKLAKRLQQGHPYLIEPYLDKVHDFSVQYEIRPGGQIRTFEPRFFVVDSHFRYQGALLGRRPPNSAYRESLSLIEKNRSEWFKAHAAVFEHLQSLNYHGPVGIDCLIHRFDGELKIAPVIEVNVRYTMGRIALEIEQALKKQGRKSDGFWAFYDEQHLVRSSCRNFKELEQKLRGELGSRLVVTTPSSSKTTWTFAVLDQSLMERFLKL